MDPISVGLVFGAVKLSYWLFGSGTQAKNDPKKGDEKK